MNRRHHLDADKLLCYSDTEDEGANAFHHRPEVKELKDPKIMQIDVNSPLELVVVNVLEHADPAGLLACHCRCLLRVICDFISGKFLFCSLTIVINAGWVREVWTGRDGLSAIFEISKGSFMSEFISHDFQSVTMSQYLTVEVASLGSLAANRLFSCLKVYQDNEKINQK